MSKKLVLLGILVLIGLTLGGCVSFGGYGNAGYGYGYSSGYYDYPRSYGDYNHGYGYSLRHNHGGWSGHRGLRGRGGRRR